MRVIGRTAKVDFPEFSIFGLLAKVDTGARHGSLHVENMREELRDNENYLVFNPISADYPEIAVKDFTRTIVKSSFGDTEERYKIVLVVKRRNYTLTTPFTLTNRGSQRTAVLLGRKYLKDGGFVVDIGWRAKQ